MASMLAAPVAAVAEGKDGHGGNQVGRGLLCIINHGYLGQRRAIRYLKHRGNMKRPSSPVLAAKLFIDLKEVFLTIGAMKTSNYSNDPLCVPLLLFHRWGAAGGGRRSRSKGEKGGYLEREVTREKKKWTEKPMQPINAAAYAKKR